jgi:hypothetical protein
MESLLKTTTEPWFVWSIRNDLLNAMDVDYHNKEELIDTYLLTFKIRHNLIHQSVVYWLGLPSTFAYEKKVGEIFADMPKDLAKFTPDITISKSDLPDMDPDLLILDVSVSTTKNLNESKKNYKIWSNCEIY